MAGVETSKSRDAYRVVLEYREQERVPLWPVIVAAVGVVCAGLYVWVAWNVVGGSGRWWRVQGGWVYSWVVGWTPATLLVMWSGSTRGERRAGRLLAWTAVTLIGVGVVVGAGRFAAAHHLRERAVVQEEVARCQQTIGAAARFLAMYRARHEGKYPGSWDELLKDEEVRENVAPGVSPPWVFVGGQLGADAPTNAVVLMDKSAAHRDGSVHVLFVDGRVGLLGPEEVASLERLVKSGVRPVVWPAAGSER